MRKQERERERKKASVAELERVQGELEPGASRRSAEQAVLPIGWHCVQRRGARPSSVLVVFPRRVSFRLGDARRFPSLSVPAGMLRRAAPHRATSDRLLSRGWRLEYVRAESSRTSVLPRRWRNVYEKFDDAFACRSLSTDEL